MADQDRVYFFDPLFCKVSSSIALPPPEEGNRYIKLQYTSDALLLSRSDGYIIRVKLPQLTVPDLSLLTIRRGNKEATAEKAAAAVMKAKCSAVKILKSVTPSEGASTSSNFKLFHSFSVAKGLLAIVNAVSELIIMKVTDEGGASRAFLSVYGAFFGLEARDLVGAGGGGPVRNFSILAVSP